MIKISAFNLNDLEEKMASAGIDTIDQIEKGGILSTSNHGGIAILINSTGETVFVQKVWNGGKSEIEECEIVYGKDEVKFYYNGEMYLFAEFIRNNYPKK